MSRYMDADFLLDTAQARKLYHDVAKTMPIIDYHSHLPPAEIAQRKGYRDITELWLGADHYKWRLMRSAGVEEALITGDADPRDKFLRFCRIMPMAVGNPIYHWCHLELRQLFGLDAVIDEASAAGLWDALNERLAGMDSWSFLRQARVEVVCTTDDPADDLSHHRAIAASELETRVVPAFRPDRAMKINDSRFIEYLHTLSALTGESAQTFAGLARALASRIAVFHRHGARVSDHGVDLPLPAQMPSETELEALFQRRLDGQLLDPAQQAAFQAGLLAALGRHYAEHGWTMCLHIGAQRNNNSRQFRRLGADAGFDSISDMSCGAGIAALLDKLDAAEQLPKTILFCLNPGLNEVLSTMLGNFQGPEARGKVQFGPAWWFNDHQEGNLAQLRTLAAHSALGAFVGMVTDSRSFASFPRHDYFRRLLCRQLGRWMAGGEYPDDAGLMANLTADICYRNAKHYFRFD